MNKHGKHVQAWGPGTRTDVEVLSLQEGEQLIYVDFLVNQCVIHIYVSSETTPLILRYRVC